MISQPMGGKTNEEILETRNRAIAALKAKGYEVVNTLFDTEWQELAAQGCMNRPLAFLAKSLEVMSQCHAVYFCDGWDFARGCSIEHAAASAYNLTIIYETVPEYLREFVTDETEQDGEPDMAP
jgi:hypothetical protein